MAMTLFGPNDEDRTSYGTVLSYMKNCFVEATPSGPTSNARMVRPGLLFSYAAGDGPIRGMYQNPGAVDGATYIVSDDEFYQNSTMRGNVATGDRARFAGSATQIVVVQGGNAYSWNGATFAIINDTDLPPNVIDVAYAFGRFIYAIAGTDTFYYSVIGDARQIDGLAFATAESNPDSIQAIATLSDEIAFFGQRTTEWWSVTSDPDLPFQRTLGRRYDRGTAAQGSVQNVDNSLLFIGDDGVVYRTGNAPIRVSTHSIEEAIRKCEDLDDSTSITPAFDGHKFYGISLPGQGTYLLDLSNNTWAQWTSTGQVEFRCRWGVNLSASQSMLGDSESGKIFRLDPETYTDDGGTDPIDCIASLFVPVDSGFVPCSSIMLQCRRGVGNINQPAPTVSLRYSDDCGQSWNTTPGAISLGQTGDFDFKPTLRRLGRMQSPGRLFEFSSSDPVSRVFEGITLNAGRP